MAVSDASMLRVDSQTFAASKPTPTDYVDEGEVARRANPGDRPELRRNHELGLRAATARSSTASNHERSLANCELASGAIASRSAAVRVIILRAERRGEACDEAGTAWGVVSQVRNQPNA